MSTVVFGSDHAGFALKMVLIEHAKELGVDVIDVGTYNEDRVDYPDFGEAVGVGVATGKADLGVAVCGSGIGIAMAANKVAGVRAATVHDVTSARLSREHNDANVMAVGQRFLGEQTAIDALDAFLAARFQGGRHTERVRKLNALDLRKDTK